MSSVFKAIKKVFQKVIDVVKKVAPVVVGIAALVFTGGAALGLAPAVGGWSAAASTIGTAIGGTGLLGTVLTGAITQAGYGALTGGIIAELSGGNFGEGVRTGAGIGAVSGGLLGAYSHLRTPQPTAGVTAPGAGGAIQGGAKTFPLQSPELATATPINAAGQAVPASAGGATQVATQAATPGRGLLSGIGGYLKDNPEVVGGLVKGVGAGLLAGAGADAERDLVRERHNLISSNYEGADPGARFRGAAPGTSTQTPTQRYDPKTYGSFEYQYDPSVGRIVRVPAGQ